MTWLGRQTQRARAALSLGPDSFATAPADDTARHLNPGRIELTGYIGLVDALVELAFALVRPSVALIILWTLALIGLTCFIALARALRGGKVPATIEPHLTSAYLLFLLLMSATVGYFVALGGRLPAGYAMLVLALSAIFMVPPRRFTAIAGLTFAFYLALLLATDHGVFERIVVGFNTGLGVFGAVVIRIVLYRLRQRELEQQRIIAEQNEALLRANAVLATHNSELNELMAVAAHDLRSPLFGLRNLLDLARARESAPPEFYRGVLDEGSRSIVTMLALVGRLLKAHEVESLTRIAVRLDDLRSAVVAAAHRNAVAARSAQIVIEPQLPAHPVWAFLDEETVAQILDNLLSNAIRFSPADSVIVVACRAEDDHAVISVMDAGAGVPVDEQRFLFGKFRRGSNEPQRGGRGSGLGLYISSKLAAAMGGELRHEPRPGGGTIFSMKLVSADAP